MGTLLTLNRLFYVPIYQGYPRLRREGFFLRAFIFYARTRVKNERTQKYYFPGRALLNSYADQKLFLGAMTY